MLKFPKFLQYCGVTIFDSIADRWGAEAVTDSDGKAIINRMLDSGSTDKCDVSFTHSGNRLVMTVYAKGSKGRSVIIEQYDCDVTRTRSFRYFPEQGERIEDLS